MAAISTKGVYGLAAMFELAKNRGEGPLQIRAIAQRADIPQNYLEQLLVQLRRSGLVESIRGAKGGYKLAKSPHEISVKEILEILEGEVALISSEVANAALRLFWEEKTLFLHEQLDLSLEELIQYEAKANGGGMYFI